MQQHGDTPEQRRRQQERNNPPEREQPRERDNDERRLDYGIEQHHRPIDHSIPHQYSQPSPYGQSSNIPPKPLARSMASPPLPVPHVSPYPEGQPYRPEGQLPYRPPEQFRQVDPYRPAYTTSYSYSEYPPRPMYYSHPHPSLGSPGVVHTPASAPAPPVTYYRPESREYQEYNDPQAQPPPHWQYQHQHQQPMPPPYPPYPDRRMYEQMYSTYSNIATTLPGAIQQVNLPHIDAMISQASNVAQTFDSRHARSEPRRKRKASASNSSSSLYCHSCMTTETPEWRKGPMGPRTLCNACGLIWAKLEKAKRKKEEEEAQARESSRPTGQVGTMPAPSSTQGAPSLIVVPTTVVPPRAGSTIPPTPGSSIPPTPGSTASASTVGSNSTALTSPELSKPLTAEITTKGKQPENSKS